MTMTTIHRELFAQRYLSNVTDTFQLATNLCLTPEDVQRYMKELDAYLTSKLNKITPERLVFVCSNCLGTRVLTDPERSERVCPDCGYVLENQFEELDSSLPFSTTFATVSNLAVQRSQGTDVPLRDQWKLQKKNGDGTLPLALFQQQHPEAVQRLREGEIFHDEEAAYLLDPVRNRVCKASIMDVGRWALTSKKFTTKDKMQLFHLNDVPLRIKRIRGMTCSENPELDALLYIAYEISTKYGFEKDKVFNDNLGSNIRRAYWLINEIQLRIPKHKIAATVFYLMLCQREHFHVAQSSGNWYTEKDNAQIVDHVGELSIDHRLLNILMKHNSFLEEARVASNVPGGAIEVAPLDF